jgi:hypothetical protein
MQEHATHSDILEESLDNDSTELAFLVSSVQKVT